MPERSVSILLFRPKLVDGKIVTDGVMQEAFSCLETMQEEKRTKLDYPKAGAAVRVRNLKKTNDGLWHGEMVRIRMSGIPEKCHQNGGKGEPLPLDDDEGLGESTAFLYSRSLRLLVFMRNFYAGSPKALAELLCLCVTRHWERQEKETAQKPKRFPKLAFVPHMRRDDPRKKFDEMEAHKSLEFSISLSDAPDKRDPQAKRLISNFEESGCSSFRVILGGTKDTPLTANWVKSTISDIFQMMQNKKVSARKLCVVGAEGDKPFEVLDLLKNRWEIEENISWTGRSIPYESIKNAVRRAFDNHQDQLEKELKLVEIKESSEE